MRDSSVGGKSPPSRKPSPPRRARVRAVGLASGTAALALALQALGVGPGDEVITTPHTFFATVEPVISLGATPVFVDIDPATYNLDPALIEAAITPATRVILPVHLYGQMAPMEAILHLAHRHGLAVIEDAAQAHAAEFQGRRAGQWSHVACFSFYPGKNLGAYGDAGAICTDDDALADTVAKLRDHGRVGKYAHDEVGCGSGWTRSRPQFWGPNCPTWKPGPRPGAPTPPPTPPPCATCRGSFPRRSRPTRATSTTCTASGWRKAGQNGAMPCARRSTRRGSARASTTRSRSICSPR